MSIADVNIVIIIFYHSHLVFLFLLVPCLWNPNLQLKTHSRYNKGWNIPVVIELSLSFVIPGIVVVGIGGNFFLVFEIVFRNNILCKIGIFETFLEHIWAGMSGIPTFLNILTVNFPMRGITKLVTKNSKYFCALTLV